MTHKVKKRGQSYNIKQLEELLDEGLTPKEIADELGTKSVQSVRHRVEAIRKERDAISFQENRQRMEEEKVNSMNRVGLFPYVADELSLGALKHLLPLSETGLSIIHTGEGYAILVDPKTYSTSVLKIFKLLGIYGRLCSKKDRGDQIRMMSNPSSQEELSWTEMIRCPFVVISPDDDSEKLQAFLYPYLEDGRISSTELSHITLGEVEDPEYALKSMQLDADKSPWHMHIEYDPMIITRMGYIPRKVKENDVEFISGETLNNLGPLMCNDFLKLKTQIKVLRALPKWRGFGAKDVEVIQQGSADVKAESDKLRNYEAESRVYIPVFMTQEIRQKFEEEIAKNNDYVNDIVKRALSYVSTIIKNIPM